MPMPLIYMLHNYTTFVNVRGATFGRSVNSLTRICVDDELADMIMY